MSQPAWSRGAPLLLDGSSRDESGAAGLGCNDKDYKLRIAQTFWRFMLLNRAYWPLKIQAVRVMYVTGQIDTLIRYILLWLFLSCLVDQGILFIDQPRKSFSARA